MTSLRARLDQSPLLRVGVNSVWLTAARILSQALLFAVTILLARGLGEAGLGQYAFIMSFLFLGNVVSTFGLDMVMIRELAGGQLGASNHNRLITHVALVQLAISGLLFGGIWVLAPFVPNQTGETVLALRVASLALVPMAFSTIFSAIFRAYERMDLLFVVNLVVSLILLLGTIVVLAAGGRIVAMMLVVVVSQVGGALIGATLSAISGPNFHWRWKGPSRDGITTLLPLGATLGMLMILAIAYQRMGVVLLSVLADDAATGWYTAAQRIPEAMKILPAAFLGALFPFLARNRFSAEPRSVETGKATQDAHAEMPPVELAYGGIVAVALVMAAIVTLVARPLITILYGATYEPSVTALRILVWTVPLAALAMRVSFNLIAAGRDQSALAAIAFAMALAVPLTVILIERLGLLGACLGMVAGEAIHLLALFVISRRQPLHATLSP